MGGCCSSVMIIVSISWMFGGCCLLLVQLDGSANVGLPALTLSSRAQDEGDEDI